MNVLKMFIPFFDGFCYHIVKQKQRKPLNEYTTYQCFFIVTSSSLPFEFPGLLVRGIRICNENREKDNIVHKYSQIGHSFFRPVLV